MIAVGYTIANPVFSTLDPQPLFAFTYSVVLDVKLEGHVTFTVNTVSVKGPGAPLINTFGLLALQV